jgi:hypothetical protein
MLDILAEGNTTGVNIIASKANTLPAGPRTTDQLPPAGKFAYASLTAEQREMLGTLPPKIELEPGILAVHGTPTDDSTYLLQETAGDKLVPARRELVVARFGTYPFRRCRALRP